MKNNDAGNITGVRSQPTELIHFRVISYHSWSQKYQAGPATDSIGARQVSTNGYFGFI
tara:strand:- start:763 stop:936 length:174 start_codon:yes stop_codon:yes gene_type:complete